MPEAEIRQKICIEPTYHPDVLDFLNRKCRKGNVAQMRKFFNQKAQLLYESGGNVPASWTLFRHPKAQQGCFTIGTKRFGALVRVNGVHLEVLRVGSNVEEIIRDFK